MNLDTNQVITKTVSVATQAHINHLVIIVLSLKLLCWQFPVFAVRTAAY